jgi:phage I-like protein
VTNEPALDTITELISLLLDDGILDPMKESYQMRDTLRGLDLETASVAEMNSQCGVFIPWHELRDLALIVQLYIINKEKDINE